MKKFVSIVMVLVTVFTIVTVSMVPVSAVSWPSTKNIKTYVISTGNDTTVYKTASSTSKYGTIYASDLITILGYSGSRLKVSYPVSGGSKTGYIDKSKVTSGTINYASAKWTATASMTAYRRSSGSSTIGSVSKNDVCYSIAKSGSRTQIIYPISGGYKMGWVSTSSIPNSSDTASNNNVEASLWQYPMTKSYVCGNDWGTKYSARPSRPYHVGIDIASKDGDKNVYAAADGTVVASGKNSANGNYVIIKHSISGKTVYSFYAHLKSYCVSSGKVKKGTKIGVFGNTGSASTGAHLHFAITDKLSSGGGYYGYISTSSGNARYDKKTKTTFYNPHYIIKNGKLPV